MVFITKANYKRILRKIDLKSISLDDDEVFKKPIFFLSSWETKYLLSMKTLLKNPDKFAIQVYQKVENKDTLHYVYESEASPSYHMSKDCVKLNSTFRNFEIPDEIKDRVVKRVRKQNLSDEETEKEIERELKKAVEHFRHWFKLNLNLFNEDLDEFLKQLDIRWNIQRTVKEVEMGNSGVGNIDNLNLTQLESEIDRIISEAGKFFNLNKNKQQIIRRFQKLTFLAYRNEPINQNDSELTDNELKEFLIFYDERFKKPIKELLIQYYRVKYNPDLSFSGNLLEQLNFRPCSFCSDQQYIPISNLF